MGQQRDNNRMYHVTSMQQTVGSNSLSAVERCPLYGGVLFCLTQ